MTTMTAEQHLQGKRPLSASLCFVYVTVRRPEGKLTVPNYEVLSETDSGRRDVVRDTTDPKVRFDKTPTWRALDDNEAAIRRLVSRHTATNVGRGGYLMSVLTVGRFLTQLQELSQERQVLADQLVNSWETEVLEALRSHYPEYFAKLMDTGKLNRPGVGQFAVAYEFTPIGSLRGEDLELENLSPAERQAVIQETSSRARDLMEERLKAVYDNVFGEVLELCQKVQTGAFETGGARSGTLEKILDVLERAHNFGDLADEKTLQQIRAATEYVRSIDHQSLNRDQDVRAGLRDAFRPLVESVSKVQSASRTRIARELE